MQARAVLGLKVGAQVLLVKNICQSLGLVNGTRGVVEKFTGSANILPVVRFANVSLSRFFWKPAPAWPNDRFLCSV